MQDIVEVIEAMKVFDRDYSGYRKQLAMDYAMEHDLDTFDIHTLRGIAFCQVLEEIRKSKSAKAAKKEKTDKALNEKAKRTLTFNSLKKGDWVGILLMRKGKEMIKYMCVKGIDSTHMAQVLGSRSVYFYNQDDEHYQIEVDGLINNWYGETHYLGKGQEAGWFRRKLTNVPYTYSHSIKYCKQIKTKDLREQIESGALMARTDVDPEF